jgi:DNA-directed RNA polymerase specialized sigma54-like protein
VRPGKLSAGDVRLDQLSLRVTDENYELWGEVVHNLQRGDMPPEDAKQPKADERQAFLAEAIGSLTRNEVDVKGERDPLTRLTNDQIAYSLKDLLHTHQHIAAELIGDPVDKHGYSRQTELGLSGPYLQLYAKTLARAVARATTLDCAGVGRQNQSCEHHAG